MLRDDGSACHPDGTALRVFAAIAPGTAFLSTAVGPRCLHAHPACLPGERLFGVRVDVVAQTRVGGPAEPTPGRTPAA